MADDAVTPAPEKEPSNAKVAVGAVKKYLTSDGPIEFTKKMMLALAIALAVGAGLGYFFMASAAKRQEIQVKNTQITTLKKNADESAKNALQSHQKSVAIEEAVAKGKAQADRVRREAADRLAKQQERTREELAKDHPQLDPETVDRLADPRLDLGTVRLLNDARQGAGVESTRGGNAASQAPSDVGLQELIDNDLQVVRQYHELAERHNALVDAVEKKLKEQAGEKTSTPGLLNRLYGN